MANIVPVDLVAPGARGLNTEAANTLLDPKWATEALNGVIHRSGRLGSRKGWTSATTTGISGSHQIDVLFEYLDEAGTSVIISTANNKIYKNISDFTDAANDITSTTTPTADHWKFVNFNGKILGFQRGHTPIVRTSGDFADASYTGVGPDGNTAVAAFGRVWAIDADLQTIRYSVLLDDTDYTEVNGGGTIDMSSVWTNGMDKIVAIAAIGANLIVFGQNHIVMWADGSGSEIGLDPTAIEVVDTIEGTGCVARDSVANTGEGDLLFLSRHGVQSLGRVIQYKSNPIITLSKNVRSKLLDTMALQRASDAQYDQVRATHSPEEGAYILNFPVTGQQYVFDTTHAFEDDDGATVFPVTDWNIAGIVGLVTLTTGQTYFGHAGIVGQYAGASDNDTAYDFKFYSGWLDFAELNHRLKIMKELIGSLKIGSGTVVWRWAFDFSDASSTRASVYTAGVSSEFNIAEFNIDEFSSAASVQRRSIPAHGEGQFLRVGITAEVDGFDLILQHISLAPKLGRMVT